MGGRAQHARGPALSTGASGLVAPGALAIACAVWPALSHAQMIRCEAGGRVSYQDMPCASGAREQAVAVRPGVGAGSVVNNQIVRRHYDVEGDSYEALARSLNSRGPSGFHGLSAWQVRYAYTARREADRCRVETLAFTIDGEVLLPRWRDGERAPADLRRHWERYLAALERHEAGHLQHADELVAAARQRMLALGSHACDSLQGAMQTAYDQVARALADRDRQYDERTGHGATQGARF
jgi:predicted secreted Zn-dependent protease